VWLYSRVSKSILREHSASLLHVSLFLLLSGSDSGSGYGRGDVTAGEDRRFHCIGRLPA